MAEMKTSYQRMLDITRHSDDKKCAKESGLKESTIRRYRRKLKQVDEICETPKPEIWLFDIETLPVKAFVFHFGEQRIPHTTLAEKKESSICCFSAKKLFEPEIHSFTVSCNEAENLEDSSIIQDLWDLFERADILIAHNVDRFDVIRANSRFLANGLKPPLPYQTIDTLKASRKTFGRLSHKLDYLSQIMFNKEKITTNFNLWRRCRGGEFAALAEMQKYNRQDTRLLEEVYLELRPWIKSHPNLALYTDLGDAVSKVCPTCGKETLKPEGYYRTTAGKFQSYRCECGAIARGRKNVITDKENLLLSVAR